MDRSYSTGGNRIVPKYISLGMCMVLPVSAVEMCTIECVKCVQRALVLNVQASINRRQVGMMQREDELLCKCRAGASGEGLNLCCTLTLGSRRSWSAQITFLCLFRFLKPSDEIPLVKFSRGFTLLLTKLGSLVLGDHLSRSGNSEMSYV